MSSSDPVQPATPLNDQRNPRSPRAPIRHHTDAQQHPSTLLPLSNSNFLDQNNFPSLQSPYFISHNPRPHNFPSHYQHSQFVQPPHPQFYSSQRPYEQPYFSQPQYFYPPPNFSSHNYNNAPLPSHNVNTVPYTLPFHLHNSNTIPLVPTAILPTPLPSVPSTAPKALPSVTHIPILSGRSDFNAWNNGVRSLILYLGYVGHITSPHGTGVTPYPDRVPSYPPILSGLPSAAELALSRTWWEGDHIVSHILTSCLTTSVLAILPFDDGDVDSHEQHVKLLVSREQRMIHSPLVLMIHSSHYMPFWTFSLISTILALIPFIIFSLPFIDNYSQSFGIPTPCCLLGRHSYLKAPNPCARDRTCQESICLCSLLLNTSPMTHQF